MSRDKLYILLVIRWVKNLEWAQRGGSLMGCSQMLIRLGVHLELSWGCCLDVASPTW